MAFWDKFITPNKTIAGSSTSLHEKIRELFPNAAEDQLTEVACIAGLLARIALVDMHLHENEQEHIRQVLSQWTDFSPEEIESIASIAISELQQLAGFENHLYVYHLKPLLDVKARYQVVQALFALAASDGEVDNFESEEIRIVARGLDLDQRYFLSARAEVAQYLKALK